MQTILVTGGCGFIGSNFVRYALRKRPAYRVINLDCLTYAGNLKNLADVEDCPNYAFHKADILDGETVQAICRKARVDAIVNFAAESHVDRSIHDASAFVRTNVLEPRFCWTLRGGLRAVDISKFRRMRCTVRWGPRGNSRKRRPSRLTVPIRRVRPARICWRFLMSIPTDWMW